MFTLLLDKFIFINSEKVLLNFRLNNWDPTGIDFLTKRSVSIREDIWPRKQTKGMITICNVWLTCQLSTPNEKWKIIHYAKKFDKSQWQQNWVHSRPKKKQTVHCGFDNPLVWITNRIGGSSIQRNRRKRATRKTTAGPNATKRPNDAKVGDKQIINRVAAAYKEMKSGN